MQQNEERAVDDERAAQAFQTIPQMQGDQQQRAQRDTRICNHCHRGWRISEGHVQISLLESHQYDVRIMEGREVISREGKQTSAMNSC
jgi:hypothetical protein